MRLFFALQPDPPARRRLAELADSVAQMTGGRAPRAENLHVTLAFLGEVAADRANAIEAIGGAAALVAAPFHLALDHVGMFRHAGIAWIGPDAKPDPLVCVFEALRAALQQAGLRVDEREFRPHVTLARHCQRPLRDIAAPRIEWRVDALTLMVSETRPDGARYRELASCPLAEN